MRSYSHYNLRRLRGPLPEPCGVAYVGDSMADGLAIYSAPRVSHSVRSLAIGGETSANVLARVAALKTPTVISGTARASYALYPRYGTGISPQDTQASREAYMSRYAVPDVLEWSNGVSGPADSFLATRTISAAGGVITCEDNPPVVGDVVWFEGNAPAGFTLRHPYTVLTVSGSTITAADTAANAAITPGDLTAGVLCGPYILTDAPVGVTVSTLPFVQDRPCVIWAGANDIEGGMAKSIANIDAIAARLPRSIILTAQNNSSYHAAAAGAYLAGYNALCAYNSHIVATYGGRCVDSRQLLLDQYIPGSDNATDQANGVIASRLRSDVIHLSDSGNAVVMAAVEAKLVELGYS